jgi:hypothetical protein
MDPLVEDAFIEVTIQQLSLNAEEGNPEWDWDVRLQAPIGSVTVEHLTGSPEQYPDREYIWDHFPGVSISSDEHYEYENWDFFVDSSVAGYTRYSSASAIEGGYLTLPLEFWNADVSNTVGFRLLPGEIITLSGSIGQYDANGGRFSCSNSFLHRFSYEEIIGQAGRIDEDVNLSGGNCTIHLYYSVEAR